MSGAGPGPLVIIINIVITGVLLRTKMLKKTEETTGFVVIIFIIGGILIGVPLPPGYAYGAEQVDATQTHHERWSAPGDSCDFLKKK